MISFRDRITAHPSWVGGCCLITRLLLLHYVMLLQQATKLHLALKPSLSGDADSGEDGAIFVPQADAVEVIRTVLIVDDDGSDIVTETLLEHQQTADTTVAVIEGTDALKLHMKIEYVLEGDIGDALVTLEQGGQLFADGCGRNVKACFEGCGARAKRSGLNWCHLVSTDITKKKRVQFEGKNGLE